MAGRSNQRLRTRKALLEAAGRLVAKGNKPSLDDIAAEALVSRATAYRHFASVEALLLEASLDLASPDEAELFGDDAPEDAAARVQLVDAAFHDLVTGNETLMRHFLSHALVQGANGSGEGDPVRQNRRSPLIRAALEPARGQLPPKQRKLLERALALIIGGEAILICQDVLQLSDAEAREVKRWMIDALVAAALQPPEQKAARPRRAT